MVVFFFGIDPNNVGVYWSKSLSLLSHEAYILLFDASKTYRVGNSFRYLGLSIRPVCP